MRTGRDLPEGVSAMANNSAHPLQGILPKISSRFKALPPDWAMDCGSWPGWTSEEGQEGFTSMPMLKHHIYRAALVMSILMAISGCMSTQTVSPVGERLDSLGVSYRGARDANIRLAYQDGLVVEQAADSIIRLAPDRAIALSAHRWKIYGIPVIRQIYSQSDPLLAAADALAFSLQCRDYFTTGLGNNRFGEYQPIAVRAVEVNAQRLIDVNRERLTAADFDSLMSRLSRWVTKYPITNDVFSRRSVFADLDAVLAHQDHSVGSAVGRIADDVGDLSGRLSLFAAQLPREARWQGEYILTEVALEERLNRVDTTIAVLTSTLEAMEQDIRAGTIVVDIAGLRTLHSDIQATLALLSEERAILVSEVERIRLETLAATEEAVERISGHALDRIMETIDGVLWKVAGFCVAGFVAVAVLLFSLQRMRRLPR